MKLAVKQLLPGRFKTMDEIRPSYICCKAYEEQYKIVAGKHVYVVPERAPIGIRACSFCGFHSSEMPILWVLSKSGYDIVPMPAELIDVDEGANWENFYRERDQEKAKAPKS